MMHEEQKLEIMIKNGILLLFVLFLSYLFGYEALILSILTLIYLKME
jgi:hypothetical protein